MMHPLPYSAEFEDLQRLMDRCSNACKEFSLTISQKNTEVMGKGMLTAPSIKIAEYLEVVHEFV